MTRSESACKAAALRAAGYAVHVLDVEKPDAAEIEWFLRTNFGGG